MEIKNKYNLLHKIPGRCLIMINKDIILLLVLINSSRDNMNYKMEYKKIIKANNKNKLKDSLKIILIIKIQGYKKSLIHSHNHSKVKDQ